MPSEKAAVKVMLVDDHQIMLDGLRKMLEATGEFEIVGVSQDGDEAISLARQVRPDVVILDVIMPGKDGIETCRELTEELPNTRVLILTASNEDDAVIDAISAGATGFLRKLSGSQKLLDTIRDVAEGEYRFPQEVMRRVFSGIRTTPRMVDTAGMSRLTDREKQILKLFAWGRSYADIARLRGNQTVTIRNAVYGIQRKLGVHSKQEMVLWAARNGLLDDELEDVQSSVRAQN